MAKLVYLGGGSTSRPVKKLYIGVDGVSKKIKRGYVGDEAGKARLFYLSSYIWNRYTIITTNHYTVEIQNSRQTISWYENNPLMTSALYTTTIPTQLGINQDGTFQGLTLTTTYRQVPVGGYANIMVANLIKSTNMLCHITDRRTGSSEMYQPSYEFESDVQYITKKTGETQSQGSFIDTVESDNENTYPDNGISGNYWYVKIS